MGEAIEHYRKLCSGWLSVVLREAGNWGQPDRKRREGVDGARLSFAKRTDYVVALDRLQDGRRVWAPDSVEFAQFMGEVMRGSWHRLLFVVGGADGLPVHVLDGSDRVLSLSRLTYPHDLAPLILVEQIYRSLTILHRHPYHR
jgi:rRNA large subunit m3Psi methyltransferase RlmH